MSALRQGFYVLMACTGLVVPWFYNVRHIAAGGDWTDLPAVFRLAFANPVSSSLTVDLLVAFVVFAVWCIVEARRLGMRGWWLYPLLGFTLAFAFAFPLFLLMRERHLGSRERHGEPS